MTAKLRMLLTVTVCTVLPLLTASAIAYWAARTSFSAEIQAELDRSSHAKMRRFEQQISTITIDLDTWSGQHVLQDVLIGDQNQDIARELGRLAKLYPVFQGLEVIDLKGKVVAAASSPSMFDASASSLLEAIKAGTMFQGDVDIGAAAHPTMTFAVPIRADYDPDTVVGGLVATLDWSEVTRSLGTAAVEGQVQSDDRHIVLTDRSGRLLFGDTSAFKGGLGAGPTILAGIAHSKGTANLQDPGWTLQEIITAKAAFAAVDQMGRYMVAASLGVTLLAVLAGMLTLDRVFAGRSLREAERLKALADAAVEGIVVCQDRCIVDANEAFVTLIGRSLEQLKGMSLESLASEQRRAALADELARTGPVVLVTELQSASGQAIAAELVRRDARDAGRTVVAVRDLRERTQAEARIQHLAHYDGLTGLANRSFFLMRLDEEIARARRTGKRVALHFVDLDRFKEVNDTFGHAAGDALLLASAQRLEALARAGGVVGRLGGDEFVMLQVDLDKTEDAWSLAEHACAVMGAPVKLDDGEVITTASLGFAIYPDNAASAEDLMLAADLAVYRAKEDGRATFRAFEADMADRVRARRSLQADLQTALDTDQIKVVYQPQYDTQTSELVGFEALVRWAHPEHGPISPMTFVALAEESGLIHALGAMVLHEACREASRWRKPLRIAINLSPHQIVHGDLTQLVHRTLLETGLPASRLELEITEGVLIRDTDRALHVLRQVKALGVRIAMDDFGTGYSSLGYLQSFPFDVIKIDRSFIQNIESSEHSRAIVRTVIGLGRGLGLSVVAEGIETAEQFAFVRDQECDEVQGYLTGRPQPIACFDPPAFLNSLAGSSTDHAA